MFEKTKALCQKFLDMGVPGFDLMVYKDGKEILRHKGGYNDLESQTPIRGNERYHIYSCSKPITCVAAMQLWEQGKFSLEDKLSDYIPEFAQVTVKTPQGIQKARNPILIRHLFEMTAGLSYTVYAPPLRQYYASTGYRCPTLDTVRQLPKVPLLFEPGTSWKYSLCHDVLAALVEVWSGQKFQVYVKEHIFDVLGMEHTDFLVPKDRYHTLATHYAWDTKLERPVVKEDNWYRPGTEYASGGAGCVSTVEDYIKFAEELRCGTKLLKRETYEMMFTDRLTPEQTEAYTQKTAHGYGLGLWTPKAGGSRPDVGWGGAAGALLAVDIPNGISLFYIQHMLYSPNQPIRQQVYTTVLEELTGIQTHQSQATNQDKTLTY